MKSLLLLAALCMPGPPTTTVGTVVDITSPEPGVLKVYVSYNSTTILEFKGDVKEELEVDDEVLIIDTPCEGAEMRLLKFRQSRR